MRHTMSSPPTTIYLNGIDAMDDLNGKDSISVYMDDHRAEDGIVAFNGSDPSPGTTNKSAFDLGDFCIDEPRPMKVVVIGAGYSGITAGIRFRQRVKNLDLTIYDKNAGVGGTWYSNKYPGLACDLPSHTYQLTFSENPNWSAFYAPGREILEYLESVVDKYKIMPYIKLQHCLTCARWNEETGKWHLTIRRSGPGDTSEFEDTADVLFTAMGSLSRWNWPDIEGLYDFRGKIIHSAQWETGEGDSDPHSSRENTVKSWSGKRVGVIGVGSSAIQIVAALQPKVGHLVNYVRGKTWISPTFVREILDRLSDTSGTSDNYTFTEADKARFKDPEYYRKFRQELESDLNAVFPATLRENPGQADARVSFRENMLKKLTTKPWIAEHIIPDFPVACRRLTPGPGYLEALCKDNVEFVSELIKRVTPNGIENVDGTHRDLDIIVCATGFDTSYIYDFPIIGRDGVHLKDKWTPHPRTYMSVAVDGFPNWFQSLGPNSGVGAGSLLVIAEREVEYAVAATLKLQRERLRSMEVKKEAVDDFDQYIDSFFPRSVFGAKCRSWYKAGKEDGRVIALWPGSALHCIHALEHPRWEDYNYRPLDNKPKNRFYWFGEGQTFAEKVPGSNLAWYLDPKHVDIPPVPE
ncbi:flavin-binding [Moniliophthora roreri]|nr:flavin-binding [Moniliophthora roreri]